MSGFFGLKMIVSAYYRCSGAPKRVQKGDKCRKVFSLICKNVLTDPLKYGIMGAAGFVDIALALRFSTGAEETSLSHFTLALRRMGTFVALSL
jgi:hypothetical protein